MDGCITDKRCRTFHGLARCIVASNKQGGAGRIIVTATAVPTLADAADSASLPTTQNIEPGTVQLTAVLPS